MSSYLSLIDFEPDLILSSCALRSQITADKIIKKIGSKRKIHYMNELYIQQLETLLNVIALQDDQYSKMMIVGHNPQVIEIVNFFIEEYITELPTLGIIELNFQKDTWEEVVERKENGKLGFFVYPNQFRHYMPKSLRNILNETK